MPFRRGVCAKLKKRPCKSPNNPFGHLQGRFHDGAVPPCFARVFATKKPTGGRLYLSLVYVAPLMATQPFRYYGRTRRDLHSASISRLQRVFQRVKFGRSCINRLLSGVTFLRLLRLFRSLFYSLVHESLARFVNSVKRGYNVSRGSIYGTF